LTPRGTARAVATGGGGVATEVAGARTTRPGSRPRRRRVRDQRVGIGTSIRDHDLELYRGLGDRERERGLEPARADAEPHTGSQLEGGRSGPGVADAVRRSALAGLSNFGRARSPPRGCSARPSDHGVAVASERMRGATDAAINTLSVCANRRAGSVGRSAKAMRGDVTGSSAHRAAATQPYETQPYEVIGK